MQEYKRKEHQIFHWITLVGFLFLFQITASKLGAVIANQIDYGAVDKDNLFLNISVHHLVQMLIALLLIFLIYKKKGLHFYLKPKKHAAGIRYTVVFSVVILGYVLISYLIGYLSNTIASYPYELNFINVAGTLGFQLLLSGTSEELLFRALPITLLTYGLKQSQQRKDFVIILVSAALFAIAHISWQFNPFEISFSWFQVLYAFLLGIVYGITYVKSRSIIYPMMMHGFSNFFMVGVGYLLAVLL